MKIKFNKINTTNDNLTLFNGEDNININRKDFDLAKTDYGAIPLDAWCKDLSSIYTLDDREYYPEFSQYHQDLLKNSKYIEIMARDFTELQAYSFDPDKIYRLHINNENMSHAGSVDNELATFIKTHNNIIEVIVDKDVSIIGEYAFSECNSLVRIKLSENIDAISAKAFFNCSSLRKINIPYRVSVINEATFQGCSSLVKLRFPESLSGIRNLAFSGCTSLEEVNALNNLDSLGESAFENCVSLRNITLGRSLISLGRYSFHGCSLLEEIELPNSLSIVGFGAFQGCQNLSKVSLGDDIDAIENSAFAGCTILKNIIYDNTIEHWKAHVPDESLIGISYNHVIIRCTDGTIPEFVKLPSMPLEELKVYPFDEEKQYELSLSPDNMSGDIEALKGVICSHKSIKEIVVETGTKEVKANAFSGCNNISKITLPDTLETIGDSACQDCNNLETLNMGNGVRHIGNRVLQNCKKITSAKIPDSVETVGHLIFCDCSSLTSIDFGNGVNTIGFENFKRCINLTELNIPSNITIIESGAFQFCSNLTKVTTSDNLETLGDYVFGDCTSLEEVHLGSGLKTIGDNTFINCTELTKISYNNTKESWSTIVPDISAIGLSYEDVLVVCTDGAYLKIIELDAMDNESLVNYPFRKDGYYILHFNQTNISELGSDEFGEPFRITKLLQKNTKIFKIILDSYNDLPKDSFINCNHIQELVYNGTSDDWINNNLLKKDTRLSPSAIVYCTDKNIYSFEDVPEGNTSEFILSLDNLYEVGEGHLVTEFIKNNTYMDTVLVGSNLEYLSSGTFTGCSRLKKLLIPLSITTIRDHVFTGCTSLTDIFYAGTIIQWKSISTNYDINGFDRDLTAVHCTDGVIRNKNIELFNCTPEKLSGYNFNTGDTYNLHLSTENLNQSDLADILNNNISIDTVSIDDDVVEIKDNAFKGCKNIINFNIGKYVTRIGVSAFEKCEKIKVLNIPDNVVNIDESAFKGSLILEEISLGNGITDIKTGTFSNCKKLKTVNIGTGVISIRHNAFEKCDSLVDLILPPNVNSIEAEAFIDCRNLESISGDNIGTIEDRAFYNCRALVTADFAKVTNIGVKVFYNCLMLSNFTMPRATNIGEKAFQNCSSLKTISMMDTINIGNYAFRDCEELTDVNLSNTLKIIPEGLFSGCDKLKQISIGSATQKISEYAFFGCTELASVFMCNEVTVIGKSAFEGCRNLVDTTLSNILGELGERAFYDCRKLESIRITPSLSIIGNDAFKNCYSFKTFQFIGSSGQWKGNNEKLRNIGLDIKDIQIACTEAIMPSYITIPANKDTDLLIKRPIEDNRLYRIHILPENFVDLGYDEREGGFKKLTRFLQENEVVQVSLDDNIPTLPARAFENTNVQLMEFYGRMENFDKVIEGHNISYIGLDPIKTKVSCTNGALNKLLYISDDKLDKLNVNRLYSLQAKNITPELLEKVRTTSNILELSIDDGLVDIEKQLLSGCQYLRKIAFPNSLMSIEEDSFYSCSSLKEIDIPSTNDLFEVKNKALYNKPLTVFKKATDVDILEIKIEGTVRYIENNSLRECKKLQDIYFDGTREQWDKLGMTGLKTAAVGIDYNKTNIICNDYVILKQLSSKGLINCNFQSKKGFMLNLTSENLNDLGIMDDNISYTPLLKSLQDRICIRQIFIHKEADYVPERAFEGIENLETIFYDGTREEWSYRVPSLAYIGAPNATVICSDGIVQEIELPLMTYDELRNYEFKEGREYTIHADEQLVN